MQVKSSPEMRAVITANPNDGIRYWQASSLAAYQVTVDQCPEFFALVMPRTTGDAGFKDQMKAEPRAWTYRVFVEEG